MIQEEYGLHDIVEMKKEHPCHKSKLWTIVRMGADIKIQCHGCGSIIMMPRNKFDKKIKRLVEKHSDTEVKE